MSFVVCLVIWVLFSSLSFFSQDIFYIYNLEKGRGTKSNEVAMSWFKNYTWEKETLDWSRASCFFFFFLGVKFQTLYVSECSCFRLANPSNSTVKQHQPSRSWRIVEVLTQWAWMGYLWRIKIIKNLLSGVVQGVPQQTILISVMTREKSNFVVLC